LSEAVSNIGYAPIYYKETLMSAVLPQTKSTTAKAKTGLTWATKNGTQKAIFVLKACLMICSGGFIFANVFVENDVYPTYGEE
jgi:hypothetical protein